MQPNFDSSEYLIVDQLSYRLSKPRRADVVIFKYPKDTSIFFIKRVIGLPNETVKMDSGELTIKNTDFPEGFGVEEPYIKESIEDTFIVTLKDDEYFVLGDNRKHSSDSRIWGPLEDKFIVGKPFVRLFPINEFSVYPGDYSK